MRRLSKSIVASAAVLMGSALLLSGPDARAQSPSERGRVLLNDNCGRCHAVGKTGKSPHEAAPAFRTLGHSFDLDEFAGRLERGLMPGHPDMPAFKFERDDARAVVAYLRDIQE
ncbi:MAG: c-type cytochrome [Rhodopseudomonas sp.]|nr:c-type cytochrome [Rhodopseudomonas sp.]